MTRIRPSDPEVENLEPEPAEPSFRDAFAEAGRLGKAEEPEPASLDDVTAIEEEADADPAGDVVAGASMAAWFTDSTPEFASQYWQSLAATGIPMDLAWLAGASPEVVDAIMELIPVEPYEEEPRISVTQAVGAELTRNLGGDNNGAPTPEVAVERMKARMVRFRTTQVQLTRARRESVERRMGRPYEVRLTTPRWGRHVRRAPRRVLRVSRARVAIRGSPSSDADPAGGDPPRKRGLIRAPRRHLSPFGMGSS